MDSKFVTSLVCHHGSEYNLSLPLVCHVNRWPKFVTSLSQFFTSLSQFYSHYFAYLFWSPEQEVIFVEFIYVHLYFKCTDVYRRSFRWWIAVFVIKQRFCKNDRSIRMTDTKMTVIWRHHQNGRYSLKSNKLRSFWLKITKMTFIQNKGYGNYYDHGNFHVSVRETFYKGFVGWPLG